jgi:hypothetical protein
MRCAGLILSLLFILSCAGHVLQRDHADQALKTEEYDQKLNVKIEEPATTPPPSPEVKPIAEKAKPEKKKKKRASAKAAAKAAKAEEGPRQPEIEDSENMKGRRPLKDPFRVGEKVTLALSYFNIVAGTMDVEVGNFVTVNGEKAYNFIVTANSNSFFNRIYAVQDQAVTYMSYDRLVPLNLQISIKESKQLAETRTFFDWKTLRASYWQKRITKEHGEESKKLDWDIKDYTQNVISAAYYMRIFTMTPGKKLAFRVADEGKNIVFTGEVLRKEKLQTAIGELNTVVLKPTLTVDGVFTPVGEILVWMTDDDRKFIVRIESKIRIGSLVAKIQALKPE